MEHYDIGGDLKPYERLAVAIVKQAVQDYYDTQLEIKILRPRSVAWERKRCNLYLLENWFLGDWCGALTYGNGENLLRLLKKGEL